MSRDDVQSSLFGQTYQHTRVPLADACRPVSLDDFIGQDSVVGPDSLLRRAVELGELTQSMIFWGPPGCGKTTLARLIAGAVRNRFVPFSAVTSSIRDVRAVIADARKLRAADGLSLLLFVDEIHRFNRAQQDAFLPHIEDGTIVFIGATTENPGFEVIAPLLSRSRVCVFEALDETAVAKILHGALARAGDRFARVQIGDDIVSFLAAHAGGDARVALNALDYVSTALPAGGDVHTVTKDEVADALQRPAAVTDHSGESHYNLISALHKSLRGGDADAALYWLARMCEAGEDPLYIARRLVRFASEDIGNADPMSLLLAMAARDAVAFTGYPECKVNLAQCVTWLALAPKSNAAYRSYNKAARCVRDEPPFPVPLHLRNAPVPLMKELGYGKDYVYTPDDPEAEQEFLPDALRRRRLCVLGEAGREKTLSDRLRNHRDRRSDSRDAADGADNEKH